jgi:exopolysaccharide biosynthesis polyprenyl glycosylphosphotransferase
VAIWLQQGCLRADCGPGLHRARDGPDRIEVSVIADSAVTTSEQNRSAPGPHPDASADPSDLTPGEPGRHWPLRRMMVGCDAAAIAAAWLSVSFLLHRWSLAGLGIQIGRLAAVTATGLVILGMERLYRARVAPVRSVELVRLGRVALGTAVAAYVVGLISRGQRREAVIGAVSCYVLLAVSRRLFASWLGSMRRRGKCLDPVVVVGSDIEAASMAAHLQRHPEFGCRVCGLVADSPPSLVSDEEIPLLGPPTATLEIVRRVGATGTIMSAGGLSPDLRNRLFRDLMEAGVYVQLSTGLSGISYRRLRTMPLGHQPYFGVEPIALGRAQLHAKRAFDVLVAPLLLLLSAPILIAAAALIKIEDRGPILFRQRRVGRDGRLFMLYKLRSMSVDAEQRLADLAALNERSGPLFKVTEDPRVTRIGRFLRATSIDEIPQLINVLLGQMTLVGPRPALPHEVEQFDEELLGRHRMTPGITGMWQVEARDDPSFESYRLYDMFYIENWSLSLDAAILFGTLMSVVGRAFRQLAARRQRSEDHQQVIDLRRSDEGPSDRAWTGPSAAHHGSQPAELTTAAQATWSLRRVD